MEFFRTLSIFPLRVNHFFKSDLHLIPTSMTRLVESNRNVVVELIALGLLLIPRKLRSFVFFIDFSILEMKTRSGSEETVTKTRRRMCCDVMKCLKLPLPSYGYQRFQIPFSHSLHLTSDLLLDVISSMQTVNPKKAFQSYLDCNRFHSVTQLRCTLEI